MWRWLVLWVGVLGLAGVGLWLTGNPVLPPLAPDTRIDRILVEKGVHRMQLYAKGEVVRSYQVALGREPGAKMREGDNRTPTGTYRIDWHNPKSGYYRSLHVSYPSPEDVARAQAGGYAPGGMIMIHGMRPALGWIGDWHNILDWTHGCIAVTNAQMDELWATVPDGTVIELRD